MNKWSFLLKRNYLFTCLLQYFGSTRHNIYICITCKYTAHNYTDTLIILKSGMEVNKKSKRLQDSRAEINFKYKNIHDLKPISYIKLLSNHLLTIDKVVCLSGVFSPYLIKIIIIISQINVSKQIITTWFFPFSFIPLLILKKVF